MRNSPRSRSAAVFRPIGRVQDGAVLIDRRHAPALAGIEGFSHIIVLFWLHEARKASLRLHPKGRRDLPLIGTLATRTPHRFNPIGMSVVPLLRRKGARLIVSGLDAWDGTPILDIKPYTKRDAVLKLKVPAWVKKLDAAETDPLRKYDT